MGNGFLTNGLLGMGGMGGGQSGMNSLLGDLYDPREMRKQQMKQMLLGMGVGLMSEKGMGRGAELALVAGNRAADDYRQSAFDAYRLKMAEEDRAYGRERDQRADAWQNTQMQWRMEDRQAQEDQAAAADAAWNNLRTMPTTGIPVQNYGMADQLWQMGKEDEALGLVMPKQPEQLKPTDDMREYAMAVQQGYQGTFQQYLTDMKKAGATTVNMGGGTDKQIFDETKVRADGARTAFSGLQSLSQAEQALPGAITGAAADQRLALQKIAQLFGAGDTEAIVDTETFRSAIAPQVAAMLRATVGSTQISNADREFAEKAAAGSITLDGQAIQRLINIMQAMNSETVRRFSTDLDAVYPEGQGFERERALFGVPNVPKMYPEPIGPQAPQSANVPRVRKYNPQTGRIE